MHQSAGYRPDEPYLFSPVASCRPHSIEYHITQPSMPRIALVAFVPNLDELKLRHLYGEGHREHEVPRINDGTLR